jgi:hypothetical protein
MELRHCVYEALYTHLAEAKKAFTKPELDIYEKIKSDFLK